MFEHALFLVCAVSYCSALADINLGASFVQYQSGSLMFYVCQCILYQPMYFSKGNANDAVLLVYKLSCVQEKSSKSSFINQVWHFY